MEPGPNRATISNLHVVGGNEATGAALSVPIIPIARGYPGEVPYVRTLRDRLSAAGAAQRRRADPEGAQATSAAAWYSDLEQLPYTAHAMYDAVARMVEAERRMLELVLAQHTAPTTGVAYAVPETEWHPVAFAFDSFLDAAVRGQNATTRYLRRTFGGTNVPESLRDLMKRLDKGALSLPAAVLQSLLIYWSDGGERLRDYRDRAQHTTLLASGGAVQVREDGTRIVQLCIPNNPTESSAAKLRYTDPEVAALPYAVAELHRFQRFLFEFCGALLDELGGPRGRSGHRYFLPKVPYHTPGGYHAEITLAAFDAECRSGLAELEREHPPEPYDELVRGDERPGRA